MPLNKASNIDFKGGGSHGIWTPWLVGLIKSDTNMEDC